MTDIKSNILSEIKLDEEEKSALKKAHSDLTAIKEELIDEAKVLEMLDKKIAEAYRLLDEEEKLLGQEMTVSAQNAQQIMNQLLQCEGIHNKAAEIITELGKYDDAFETDERISKKFLSQFRHQLSNLKVINRVYTERANELQLAFHGTKGRVGTFTFGSIHR